MSKSNKPRLFVIAGFVALVTAVVLWARYGAGQPRAAEMTNAIGLSLFFQNGQMPPVTLVGDSPRFLQEIDIVASVTTPTDEGIDPVIYNSELSSLDWGGIAQVEEDWRLGLDGSFTRQRFYRNAKWMEHSSQFLVLPTDGDGNQVGEPLVARAGKDDRQGSSDDGNQAGDLFAAHGGKNLVALSAIA